MPMTEHELIQAVRMRRFLVWLYGPFDTIEELEAFEAESYFELPLDVNEPV